MDKAKQERLDSYMQAILPAILRSGPKAGQFVVGSPRDRQYGTGVVLARDYALKAMEAVDQHLLDNPRDSEEAQVTPSATRVKKLAFGKFF